MLFTQLILAASLLVSTQAAPSPVSTRIAVVRNSIHLGPQYIAFAYNQGDAIKTKGLIMASSEDGDKWSEWASPLTSDLSLFSNPVAISVYVPDAGRDLIFVFMQMPDGQVSALVQSSSNATQFQLKTLTSDLPSSPQSTQQSMDPIQCVTLKNQTYLFVRTLSNTSQMYWNRFNGSLNFYNKKWSHLGGGDKYLKSDPCVAVNTFLERIEVFGVFDTKYVMHTWQDKSDSFNGKWEKLGGLFSPKFDSTPVAHQMGHSNYNGVLNLFVRGEDGAMHHIYQTTCDKVKNVWGPCTWDTFHKVGRTPPSDRNLTNPFSITHSIHHGIEIFVVGKAAGHLFHIWQKERDSKYSDWEDLGPLSDSSPFLSSPALLFDEYGWWEAFALDSSNSITRFLEKPLKFNVSTGQVAYDKNVTVTWAIPEDQATRKDWIGIYPKGAPGRGYVDYSYVGGSQNPSAESVPQGSLQFANILPNGTYDYRYMVNKEYDSVFEMPVTVYGTPYREKWVDMFDGISRGLGGFNTNVTQCVDDGERTVDTFKASFEAFEERKIFEGLHLFSEGLSDFRDALIQCNETDIIKIFTKFIEDLVSCTEDNCVKFLIDVGLELLIFYEQEYEIYGDIRGASNSFKVEAYEQGGICIGRVTSACLTLE